MGAESARLNRSFYLQHDVVALSRQLLGKVLVTNINGIYTSGVIVETEAYASVNDRASHAFGGKYTSRTKVMYRVGGTAYVYLCYGVHHLFNVVTNVKGIPDAVLIRGIIPLDGIEAMLLRTRKSVMLSNMGSGPGKVSKMLGITTMFTGMDLIDGAIWLEDRGIEVPDEMVRISPRIGVGYAKDDATLPYRFVMDGICGK